MICLKLKDDSADRRRRNFYYTIAESVAEAPAARSKLAEKRDLHMMGITVK